LKRASTIPFELTKPLPWTTRTVPALATDGLTEVSRGAPGTPLAGLVVVGAVLDGGPAVVEVACPSPCPPEWLVEVGEAGVEFLVDVVGRLAAARPLRLTAKSVPPTSAAMTTATTSPPINPKGAFLPWGGPADPFARPEDGGGASTLGSRPVSCVRVSCRGSGPPSPTVAAPVASRARRTAAARASSVRWLGAGSLASASAEESSPKLGSCWPMRCATR
jgi:hypothetical protein